MQGSKIVVNGTIEHVWDDPGYNFDFGSDYKEDTQKLEKAGYAKPFQWKAVWHDQVDGVLQLDRSFWRDPSTSKNYVWEYFKATPAP